MNFTNMEVRLERWSLTDMFSKSLSIPKYQRPYSWRNNHVQDLLKDTFERTASYLMGTVILHESPDGESLDIVDGQQRIVTLTVLLHVLGEQLNIDSASRPRLQGRFSESSAKVIRNTQMVIKGFLLGKSNAQKAGFRDFLIGTNNGDGEEKGGLQFSVLILKGNNALDLAYTFFDSVNSKGKALTDFDLLKAHHLMFIPPRQEALATRHNDEWQCLDESHAHLFSTIMRRLRMWARGQNRDSRQERPDYNEFCSVVEPDWEANGEHLFNRYMQPVAFRSWRRVDEKVVLSMDYPASDGESLIPTEVTQTIEGGDAFFLYAKRYHELYSTLFSSGSGRNTTEMTFVRELASHIQNFHLQNAFCAVMLLYADKFGVDRLIVASICTERIISAFRWQAKSVRIEGTFDHVCDMRIVPILLESINARHACEQLLRICQSLPPAQTQTIRHVQKRYRASLTQFYRKAQSKVTDDRVRSVLHCYLADSSTLAL